MPLTRNIEIRFNVFVDDQEADSEMGYTIGNQYIYFNLTEGEIAFIQRLKISYLFFWMTLENRVDSAGTVMRRVMIGGGVRSG
jgi:hypothetical protein